MTDAPTPAHDSPSPEPTPGHNVFAVGKLISISKDAWGPGTGNLYEVEFVTADAGRITAWTSWIEPATGEWAEPTPEPVPDIRIRLDWTATLDGLRVEFDVGGEHHISVLPWEQLEKERNDFERRLWDRIPKIGGGEFGYAPSTRGEPHCFGR